MTWIAYVCNQHITLMQAVLPEIIFGNFAVRH